MSKELPVRRIAAAAAFAATGLVGLGLLVWGLSRVTAVMDPKFGAGLRLIIPGVFLLGVAGGLWFLSASYDSMRSRRLARSTYRYARLTAHRTLHTNTKVQVLVDQPHVSPTLFEEKLGKLADVLRVSAAEVTSAVANSSAVILDDLGTAINLLQSTRTDRDLLVEIERILRETTVELTKLIEQGDKTELVRERIDDLARKVEHTKHTVATTAESLLATLYKRVEAALALYTTATPRLPLPHMGGWAISPELAVFLFRTILRERPSLIVEVGSGASTVVMALALTRTGTGQVVALESDAAFAAETQRYLDEQGLGDRVTVVHTPLIPTTIRGEEFLWYDLGRVDFPGPIDLVFIDGPPGPTGKLARYPALPLLRDHLADASTIILDDANRPDEHECVLRWQSECGPLSVEKLPHERGTYLIRYLR